MTAFDVFADADTQSVAHQAHKIGYANGGFVAEQLEQALDKLPLNQFSGFVYGSGFEAQPDLLERIEKRLPLLGNRPIVVRNLKRARQFFMLLDALHIPHPEVSFSALEQADGWLLKHAGGSGGTHVVTASAGATLPKGYYYQRLMPGSPASMLFLADGQKIRVIGFNQQWVSPSATMPYRYGGIVGHADLPESIKQQFILAAQKLTSAVGLRGLNSLDAVVNGQQIGVLEINPRLSSTFDLYQSRDCNLFDWHVRASTGSLESMELPAKTGPLVSRSRQVVYATQELTLHEDFAWPQWVADIPMANSVIAADNPVCTVLAEAESPQAARALVLSRTETIQHLIKSTKD